MHPRPVDVMTVAGAGPRVLESLASHSVRCDTYIQDLERWLDTLWIFISTLTLDVCDVGLMKDCGGGQKTKLETERKSFKW